MNRNKEINRDNYKYISSLIAQLLELDIDMEEKITEYIGKYGIDNFLDNFEKIEMSNEAYEKIESLDLILETLNDSQADSQRHWR